MPELAGDSIECIRGERCVFEGLSFRLTGGEALVLVGRNGAGKSSLLRILAGLLPPAAGRITWNETNIIDDIESHRTRIRYVGHADTVKPALSAAESCTPGLCCGVGAPQPRHACGRHSPISGSSASRRFPAAGSPPGSVGASPWHDCCWRLRRYGCSTSHARRWTRRRAPCWIRRWTDIGRRAAWW